ncbi:hypothetical protein J3Q64DRAFT_1694684 [Phycomyces blakesleeanus]|uniref:Uncharacterized protein n=2 Tax=Phycomyces blakesleeanus TaxID=4837 RepID=A0A162V5R1_PHYB8|nr:hypothetical protein PHYBLDRAFT_163218 [Phycomyces blakesleeanus NRRL 1555(-)]OAD80183.1 hypothetical protein PHYBLDRAFT_163218 [Phycomyces blakesleeanus NRRL 1555(-)]|eukprot:XP_018298223.1 hypothetical protein PHYBLDRAFT_163218 [Phycomyces blakesleeanus NRRL 1555(-)]
MFASQINGDAICTGAKIISREYASVCLYMPSFRSAYVYARLTAKHNQKPRKTLLFLFLCEKYAANCHYGPANEFVKIHEYFGGLFHSDFEYEAEGFRALRSTSFFDEKLVVLHFGVLIHRVSYFEAQEQDVEHRWT